LVLVGDPVPIASGQCGKKVYPHWTGCVRKSSIWIYRPSGIFLSQNGKGNIAVNEASLPQKHLTVKLEIFLCVYGFADGHSQIQSEPPEAFDAYEQAHTVPPPNQ
jgi:hypothetical protein